jgi:hypothetical protein
LDNNHEKIKVFLPIIKKFLIVQENNDHHIFQTGERKINVFWQKFLSFWLVADTYIAQKMKGYIRL